MTILDWSIKLRRLNICHHLVNHLINKLKNDKSLLNSTAFQRIIGKLVRCREWAQNGLHKTDPSETEESHLTRFSMSLSYTRVTNFEV